ncbi:MAG: HD-GYP domain-containing protein, partial [Rhodoferax sp.]
DYITRPINPRILQSRVKAHITDTWSARTLRFNNEYLEFEIARRAQQMIALQDVTTLALASLAETRDVDTGNHLRRTQHYVLALATHLRSHARFSGFLNDTRTQILFKCAPLHDIGKVGIPDRILLKPGRFDAQEMEIMKQHPVLGHEAISRAQLNSGASSEFLDIAKEVVYCHHEKWDGSGYPQGLVGDAIPIPARLMALAVVYDALISRRVYKAGMPHDKAVQVIMEGSGTHFDPAVAQAFASLHHEFHEIARRFADSDTELQEKADRHSSAFAPLSDH